MHATMQQKVQQKRAVYQALQQRTQRAAAEFQSKSRFFVQASGNGWAVVSASNNRLHGHHQRYVEAVRYAESLERAIDAKSLACFTVKQVGERATRWAALFGLVMIVVTGAASA